MSRFHFIYGAEIRIWTIKKSGYKLAGSFKSKFQILYLFQQLVIQDQCECTVSAILDNFKNDGQF